MEWKQIAGFPDYYISDDGVVKCYRNSKDGKVINLNKHSKGYMTAYLYNTETKGHQVAYVHRLVAIAFIPNPDNLPQVNHINGNKEDNRVENLEWVTARGNIRHSYDTLHRKSGAAGKHHSRTAKLTPTEVRIIRQTSLSNIELAQYLGITESAVSHIRAGRSYKYIK